jgi:hypothetical protein
MECDRNIDLLYIDTMVVDFNNPDPVAIHHLKEMLAISGAIPGQAARPDDGRT